jgi:hypothetical protein
MAQKLTRLRRTVDDVRQIAAVSYALQHRRITAGEASDMMSRIGTDRAV